MNAAFRNENELKNEASHLYYCFFKKSISANTLARYIKAHQEISDLCDYPSAERRTMEIIIKKQLDAAAIEPWLRHKGKRHALTRKLLLLSFLTETGANQQEFSRNASGVLNGWLSLTGNGLKSLYSLAAGFIMVRFYGLV